MAASDTQYTLQVGIDTGTLRTDTAAGQVGLTRLGTSADVAQTRLSGASVASTRFAASTRTASTASTSAARSADTLSTSVAKVDRSLMGTVKSLALVVTGLLSFQTAQATITKSVTDFADFEFTMASVQAASELTGTEFRELTSLAKDLGATTVFSASEAGKAMEFYGRAGFTAVEITKAMPGTLDLASAAAVDLGTAADVTSNLIRGFHVEASQAGKIADLMAKAANASKIDVRDLGQAMKFVGPIAAQTGRSMTETAAAIGALSDQGIQGEMAGTALRNMLSGLLDPSREAVKGIKSLGLTLEELDPQTHSILEIIQKLSKAGIDAGTAFKIWGDRGAPAVIALTSNVPRLAQLNEQLANSDGAARRMAATMENTLRGAGKELESVLEGLRISLGETLAPALRSVGEDFGAFFRDNQDEVVRFGETLGDVIQAVAAILLFLAQHLDLAKAGLGSFLAIKAGIWFTQFVAAIQRTVAALITYTTNAMAAGGATAFFGGTVQRVSPILDQFGKNIVTTQAASTSFLSTAIRPMTIGLGLLLGAVLLVNDAIVDMSRKYDREISEIVRKTNEFKASIDLLRSSTKDLTSAAAAEAETQKRLLAEGLKPEDEKAAIIRAQVLADFQRKRVDLLDDVSKRLATAKQEEDGYRQSLEKLKATLPELEKAQKEAARSLGQNTREGADFSGLARLGRASADLEKAQAQIDELQGKANEAGIMVGELSDSVTTLTEAVNSYKPSGDLAGKTTKGLSDEAEKAAKQFAQLEASLTAETKANQALADAQEKGIEITGSMEAAAEVEKRLRQELKEGMEQYEDQLRSMIEAQVESEQRVVGSARLKEVQTELSAQKELASAVQQSEGAVEESSRRWAVFGLVLQATTGATDALRAKIAETIRELYALERANELRKRENDVLFETGSLERRIAAYQEGALVVAAVSHQEERAAETRRLLANLTDDERQKFEPLIAKLQEYRDELEGLASTEALERHNGELQLLIQWWGRGTAAGEAMTIALEIQRRVLEATARGHGEMAEQIAQAVIQEHQLNAVLGETQRRAQIIQTLVTDFVQGLQNNLSTAVERLLAGEVDSFEDFFSSLGDLFRKAVADWVATLAATKFTAYLGLGAVEQTQSAVQLVSGASQAAAHLVAGAQAAAAELVSGAGAGAAATTTGGTAAGVEVAAGGAAGGAAVVTGGAGAAGELTAGGGVAAGQLTTGGATAASQLVAGAQVAAAQLAAGGAAGGATSAAGGAAAGGGAAAAGINWGGIAAAGGYSSAGALGSAVAGFAVFGVVVWAILAWQKSQKSYWAAINLSMDATGQVITEAGSHTKRRTSADAASMASLLGLAKEWGKGVKALIEGIGGELLSVSTALEVSRSGRGKKTRYKVISQFGVEIFKDAEEALEFAIIQGARAADASGLSPLVEAALRRTTARTIEQFQEQMAVVLEIDQIIDPGGADLRGIAAKFDGLRRSLMELDLPATILIETLGRLALAEIDAMQASRDAITGRERTAEEQLAEQQRRATMWNAERQLRILELELQKSRLEAIVAEVQGYRDATQAEFEIGQWRLQLRQRMLEGEAGLTEAEQRLANVNIAVIKAQIEAINQILASMPSAIDLSEIRIPTGGGSGGGGRRADQARARDLIDEYDLSRLSDFQQALSEVNARWDEATELAHGDAELLAMINDRRREEIELLRQQAAEDFYKRLRDFERDPNESALAGAVRGVQEEADQLREDFLELADDLDFGAERIARGLARIQAAEERRLQAISDQGFADLADGLAGVITDEKLRQELIRQQEIITWQLKLAQWQSEYEILVSLGRLTEAQKTALDAAFGWIAANADNLPGGANWNPTPPTTPGPDTSAGSAGPSLADQMRDLREEIADQVREWNRLDLGPLTQEAQDLVERFEDLSDRARRLGVATAELNAAWRVAVRHFVDDALSEFEQLGTSPLQQELDELVQRFEDIEAAFQEIGAGAEDMARLEAARISALDDLWERWTEGLRGLLDELRGTDPRVSAEQRFLESQRDFRSLASRARAGDLEALEQLEDAARAFRENSLAFLGGGVGSNAVLDEITGTLEQLLGSNPLTGNRPTDQVATRIDRSNDLLAGILSQLGGELQVSTSGTERLANQRAEADRLRLARAGAENSIAVRRTWESIAASGRGRSDVGRERFSGATLRLAQGSFAEQLSRAGFGGESSASAETMRQLAEQARRQEEAEAAERARRRGVDVSEYQQREAMIAAITQNSELLTALIAQLRRNQPPAG